MKNFLKNLTWNKISATKATRPINEHAGVELAKSDNNNEGNDIMTEEEIKKLQEDLEKANERADAAEKEVETLKAESTESEEDAPETQENVEKSEVLYKSARTGVEYKSESEAQLAKDLDEQIEKGEFATDLAKYSHLKDAPALVKAARALPEGEERDNAFKALDSLEKATADGFVMKGSNEAPDAETKEESNEEKIAKARREIMSEQKVGVLKADKMVREENPEWFKKD